MGNLLKMSPPQHFPVGKVFQVADQFNGPVRGTYWYRTPAGTLRGPFQDEAKAMFYMVREANDDCA